eukprot:m.445338 g.445338  ORF g.445338 m.445338 type:complete len:54 (+) comp19214_c0_seq1:206-367(+)
MVISNGSSWDVSAKTNSRATVVDREAMSTTLKTVRVHDFHSLPRWAVVRIQWA